MKKVTIVSFLVVTLAFMVQLYLSLEAQERSDETIPGQFIVVLNDNVADPAAVAQELSVRHGLALGHVYHVALKGFSTRVPAQSLTAVESDPRVRFVEPDLVVRAVKRPPPQPAQVIPTGINRIDADLSPTAKIDNNDDHVDVDIAIIDTGISKAHPDLNYYTGVNFTNTSRRNPGGDDDHGHGSHVAGIAAAIDNSIGVVGAAPGARLWAVKVLDSYGYGTTSQVIAGIDWVTARASQIEVANMSLGTIGISDALRQALQNSVAAGVFYAVAAGNDAMDVYGYDGQFETWDDFIPAAYPEVSTISAMGDSDGQPGGFGGQTSCGADDTFAWFSNFSAATGYTWSPPDYPVDSPGHAIDLAAPGVDIRSTYKGDAYYIASGTSMSAPHIAGAAALYIRVHGKPTNADGVAAVRQALIDIYSVPQAAVIGEEWKGFTGDPDANPEPLLNVEGL